MFFGSVFAPGRAYSGMCMLGGMSGRPAIPQLNDLLRGYGAGNLTISQTPGSETMPDYTIAYNADEMIVAVSGATNTIARQFADDVEKHELFDDGYALHVNVYAREIEAAMFNRYGGLPPRIFFIGYSFGGAIVHWLMTTLIRRSRYAPTFLRGVTVGSPRFCNMETARVIIPTQFVRYFAADDLVPRLPPHGDESPFLHALVGTAGRRRLNAYIHPGQGVQLQRGSLPAEQALPSRTNPQTAFHLLNYMRDWMIGLQNAHSYGNYVDLLAGFWQTDFTPPTAAEQRAEIVDQPAPRRAERLPAIDAALRQIRQEEREFLSTTKILPRKELAVVVKVGDLYVVMLKEHEVARYKSRVQAARCKSAVNVVLYEMHKASDIPVLTFKDGLQAFFDANDDLNGGASPPYLVQEPAV